MTAPSNPFGPVIRPGPERRLEAVQALLRGDRGAAERFLGFAAESAMRLDGIWSRLAPSGAIAETVLAAASPGRTATLFASPARTAADVPSLAALIETVGQGLRELDVDLGQALVDPKEPLQLEAFERGGMRRLAALSYLERALPRFVPPTPPDWPNDIRIETWNRDRRAELVQTLERTYIDTLDCPDLAGLRRGEDVLEGHLHSGRHEPGLWTILRFLAGPLAGEPAGVCLLNSSPGVGGALGTIELVYLGLVPEARGRGLARRALRHAMSLLKGRRERAIVLAVDERNEPALRIYRDAGFRPALRRIALIRPVARDA